MLTKNQEKYLATLPDDKLVYIFPFDPHHKEIAESIIAEVHAVHPEIEARFSGAVALGIAGQNDLDFDFMTTPEHFNTYLPTFTKLFGEPRDTAPNTAVWTFYRDGLEVDMWLSDPDAESSDEQWKLYLILRDNPELCAEYERLKLPFDGKSYKDYQRAKYEFYNRVLGITE